jgi:hypothetical protein
MTGASTTAASLSVSNFYYSYGGANIVAANLDIQSGGSVGTSSQPLVIQIPDAGTVDMTATDDVTLLALGGDLNVGTITAGGTATLLAPDGSVVASSGTQASGASGASARARTQASVSTVPPNISAQKLVIDARNSVGQLTTPLVTEISELQARGMTGDVALSNTGSLLVSASSRLPGLIAGGKLQVDTTVGMRVNATVRAQDQVSLWVHDRALSSQSLIVAANAQIESLAGGIQLWAPDQLQLQPGSRLQTFGSTSQARVELALTRQSAGTSAAVIQSQGQIISDNLAVRGASQAARYEIALPGLRGVTQLQQVDLSGTDFSDLVLISDLGATQGHTFTLSDTGLEIDNARILHSLIESYMLDLGAFSDQLTIQSLSKLQLVDVRGNGGDDEFLVEFTPGGSAVVRADGGTGTNSLTYDGAGQPIWVKRGVVQSLTSSITHQNLQNIAPRNIAALNGNPYLSTVEIEPLLVGLTATQRYVQRTYLQVLQRVATTAEMTQWTTYLDQAPTDLKRRTKLVDTLTATDAARTLLLQAWFITYAGRPATAAEITTWLGTFRSVSNPLTVQQRFLNSAPVYSRTQAFITTGTPDQRFVEGLWRLMTDPGTPLSTTSRDYWLNQQTKLGRLTMIKNMLGHLTYVVAQSEAFTQVINQRNAQYDTLLARGPALVTFPGGNPLNLTDAKVISPFELWRWLLTNRTA